MKPLNTFLDSKYSRLMTAQYGDQLQSIAPHIFSHMLRALKKYETQEGKIAFLLRVRDRPKASEAVQDIAQLGLLMKANDRFHELLKEYDQKS